MTKPYGVHWFRRDLRVAGNPALWKIQTEFSGRVLGIFCFDPVFLSREDFSADRFGFFMETLRELQDELRELGGDLIALGKGPRSGMEHLFAALKKAGKPLPRVLSFNRDYEPFARERDAVMTSWLEIECGVQVRTERDHLLIEPEEIRKDGGGFYQVYSAFAKKWFELYRSSEIREQDSGLRYLEKRDRGRKSSREFSLQWKDLLGTRAASLDSLAHFQKLNQRKIRVPLPQAGSLEAFRKLDAFAPRLEKYAKTRDIPSDLHGTSRLSIFLKNGSLTVPQVIARLGLENCRFKQGTGASVFLQELVWREFYYSILYHCPRVEKEAFLAQYRDLRWENGEALFTAWKEGKTGYPIIDAGMRELNSTGWMHNRVRMIVASFLTKDLLIDWRWGEKYFMNRLLDGDLAPNNGGWQWAASTGCDPQPYFRIFNPELQGRKFDPDGEYVRRFVPELKTLSSREIHAPREASATRLGYPLRVVNHASRRIQALRLYQQALQKRSARKG